MWHRSSPRRKAPGCRSNFAPGAPPLLRREGLDRSGRRLAHDLRRFAKRRLRGRSRSRTRSPRRHSAALAAGDEVNLKVDVLAKYVEKLIRPDTISQAHDPDRAHERSCILPASRRRSRTSARASSSSSSTRPTARTRATYIAAQFATPEAINFMATHGPRPDLPLPDPRALRRAGTCARWPSERGPLRTAFTVSIEAREGVSTGISAQDRCARSRSRSTRAGPRTSSSRAMSSRCAPARRRAGARRPDRGRRRPRAARRPQAGGRRLRGDEGGRDDGARPRPHRFASGTGSSSSRSPTSSSTAAAPRSSSSARRRSICRPRTASSPRSRSARS